jgi:PAS domain S-box-containing protein
MNPDNAPAPAEPQDEISGLIRTLLEAEQRLEELTGGEVDSVVSGSGVPFLLRRAQADLRAREADRQTAILNALPAHIALLNTEGVIVSVNESWRQFSGANSFTATDCGIGLNYLDVCDRVTGDGAPDAHRTAAGIRSVLGGAKSFSTEYSCHSPAESRWFLLTVTPLAGVHAHGVVIMHLNITERQEAEMALRESNEKFQQLADNISDAFWIRSPDLSEVQYISPAFEKIWGRTVESLRAKPHEWSSFILPEDRARVVAAFSDLTTTTPSLDIEYRIVRPDGEVRWVRVHGVQVRNAADQLIRHIGVVTDITGRKQMEEQVRQSQKMDALGTLAGGIAHDFNNILAAISGYTELARMALTGNPAVAEHLGAVLQGVKRAADLVRQILTFSRQQPLERRVVELGPLVKETFSLLRATIPATIEFDLSLAPDAPAVLADGTQVHQILMNLGTNAWHAMKDRPGRLGITLERVLVDHALAARQPKLRRGVYARLSVRDTGTGMDPVTMRRIFDPFFTTKAPGEGTGLGLAAVHGIMDNHDGAITVESEPGVGTVFQVYFPEHAGEAPARALAGNDVVPRGHGERILVVDDEEMLALMIQEGLLALGYEVEIATDPVAALAHVRDDPSRFALVLTDLTMPGMTGLLLTARLRQIRPDLPIILLTGYSVTLSPSHAKAEGLQDILLKPISFQALGVAVHKALAARPAAG